MPLTQSRLESVPAPGLISSIWSLCLTSPTLEGTRRGNSLLGWVMFLTFLINTNTHLTHPGHSWALQLCVGHLNSDRWCLSPSGSALWPPPLPGWRPGPWSCPPCGLSEAWTAHRSGSSRRRWGWSVRTQLLKNKNKIKNTHRLIFRPKWTSQSLWLPSAGRSLKNTSLKLL